MLYLPHPFFFIDLAPVSTQNHYRLQGEVILRDYVIHFEASVFADVFDPKVDLSQNAASLS